MVENTAPLAYRIEDVSAVAGISRTRVFQAARRGEFVVRKAGRASIVMRDDLLAWIKSLPTKGESTTGAPSCNDVIHS
jgi:hypothetical protein